MPVNLSFAKRYVSEALLREGLTYLSKDPVGNLTKILAVGKLIAQREEHRQAIAAIEYNIKTYPAVRTLAEDVLRHSHPNIREHLIYNWAVNSALLGIPRQRQLSEKLGYNIPHFLLIDPTSACNLRCKGCWAGEYPHHDILSYDRLDQLLVEAKELGIYWIVMSGGEPFLYPRLFDLAAKHNDMAFMLYTNGTLIDDKVADQIIEVGNISPAISLEGWEKETDDRRGEGVFRRITAAMDRLRARGAVFGVSLTATRENVDIITSDAFLDFLTEKGARYGWLFHYIPIGRNPDPNLMLTPEQRAFLARRVPYIRTHWPLLLADFWNDGEYTQGCIAGGRRYLHITPNGTVEPCAFVHFATDNIYEKSLAEVLQSPLFRSFQKRQPFSKDHLRPCPIIDVPVALRTIVRESGAKPTHPGAETVISGAIGSFLDERSRAWAREVAKLRAERAEADKARAAGR
jgi:MoaA/NifB/PqqE/SkfB family radical SAM enzyme